MSFSSCMTSYDLSLVPGRQCGDCTACCTVMAIDKPEIQKEAGVTCRHCTSSGCAIHQIRPKLCRDYHCGWRQLPILDENWRPDRSGVFVEVESIEGLTGLSLVLIGNPLKTLRQPWFIDFVMTGVKGDVPLSLGIPGPKGHQGASVLLNRREMIQAAHRSRSDVKNLLEKELKALSRYDFPPRRITHGGNDVGGRLNQRFSGQQCDQGVNPRGHLQHRPAKPPRAYKFGTFWGGG